MKKIIFGFLATTLLLAGTVLAMPKPISTYEPFAKCNIPGHLYLVEKEEFCEGEGCWTIAPGGAWGKLNYKEGGKFVFNGHDLVAEKDYTLIYYGDETHNDEWPYATCLASGTADADGNIHLMGSTMITPDEGDVDAEKIWLVLSSDVYCDTIDYMKGWHPAEYLFEYYTI